MSARGPWSVKGIDSKAREAALQAARDEGITLGDYLNRLLLESDRNDEVRERPPRPQDHSSSAANHDAPLVERSVSRASASALDELTRRIEATEARSRLAISDIDKSVVSLLNRLGDAEKAQQAMEGRIEIAADELIQAQALLKRRIDQLEAEDTSHQSLRAMRALENALENLSERIEKTRSEAETDRTATNARLETLTERVESVDSTVSETVESLRTNVAETIEASVSKVDRTVSEALARTEGANKTLSDRMSQVEHDLSEINHNVGTTLTKVSESVERFGHNIAETERRSATAFDLVSRLEEQAKLHQGDVGSQIEDIAERLAQAETSTNAALADLESSFGSLDKRITEFEDEFAEGSMASLRAEFEERINALKSEIAQTVLDTRSELVEQIESAAGVSTEAFSEMNSAVSEIAKRMRRTEQRQTQAVEAIGEEVAKFAEHLDKRVAQVERRNDSELGGALREQLDQMSQTFQQRLTELETRETGQPLDSITKKMDELAAALNSRVEASEERSAAAIRDFTEHVTTLTRNLQARQDESMNRLSGEIKASEGRQSQQVDEAFNRVNDRIAQVEQATSSSISPIQKAMSSLAERLAAVEDFSNPEGVSRPAAEPLSFDSFESRLGAADRQEKPARSAKPAIPASIPEPVEAPKKAAAPAPSLDDDDPWGNEPDEFVTAGGGFDDSFDEPDDGFAADVPGSGFDLDAAEFDEPASFEDDSFDTPDNFDAAPIESAGDYLSRARAAAQAAQDNGRGRRAPKAARAKTGKTGKGSSKLPLVAAASVIALTAVGAAGYMMLRGKQSAGLNFLEGPSASGEVGADTPIVPSMSEELNLPAEEIEDSAPAETVEAPVPEAEPEALPPRMIQPERPRPEPRPTPAPSQTPPPRSSSDMPSIEQDFSALELPSDNTTRDLNRSQLGDQPIQMAVVQPDLTNAIEATPQVVMTPASNYQLGMRLLEEGNIREAVRLIQSAADDGLAMAQYRMSKLYERGQGVPRDLARSREWTALAAEGGNIKAMHDLAVFFAEGEGGPQSYAGAAQWFRAAAEYGLVDSQYNLGVLYEQGLGVSADPAEALYWYAVAEAMGDPDAGGKVSELAASMEPTAAQRALNRAGAYRPAPGDAVANGEFPAAAQSVAMAAAEAVPASVAPTELALHAQVRQAQELLNELGYNAGFPDGRFGNQTRNAILAFQASNGYPQSGQVTPTLLRQMRAAADEGL